METTVIDPVHWSTKTIISCGQEVIHELALKSAGTSSAYRLVVGRCLMAVDQTRLYEKFACSGAVNYAVLVLGLGVKEARLCRLVATRLEALPRLSRAAELGRIPWGKLREIVKVASPETEGFWLELASKKNDFAIGQLVKCTEYGKLPWDETGPDSSPTTRLQLHISEETGTLFQRAVQSLSQKLNMPLSAAEALEHLVIEHLAKRPLKPEVIETARKQARKGMAASRRGHSRLVEEARQIAVELGFGETVDPLAAALGAVPAFIPDDQARPPRGVDIQNPAASEKAHEARPPRGVGIQSPTASEKAHEARPARGVLGKGPESEPFISLSASFASLDSADQEWRNPRLCFNPKSRFVTPAQREELLRRDGYCCSTPGCPNHTWLHLHHIVRYSENGKTISRNLVVLCSRYVTPQLCDAVG